VIDLDRAEGFEWDAGNSRKSADKHGVSQGEAEQVFFNAPLLVLSDERRSTLEPRHHALGQTDAGRRLMISFTLREAGRLIRVISARDMHRRDRARYEQETEADPDV
jgi:uncharacterized protein